MAKPGRFTWIFLFFCLYPARFALGQTPQLLPLSTAEPVLAAYSTALPPELKSQAPLSPAVWDQWLRARDAEIRSRLEGGEELTLANLLRLGVTYTKQPRITYSELARYGHTDFANELAERRARDLVRALALPSRNPGMQEMQALLQKKGFKLESRDGQEKAQAYLLQILAQQRDDVARENQEAKTNPYQAFKERGISTDSNLYPDYMIYLRLRDMLKNGQLKRNSVHRIAIVGPGLDFVNKKFGADFYPPQVTQPFVVVDALAKLGLADPATVHVYTFDISDRVNRLLASVRKNAAAGHPYTIQLLATFPDQSNRPFVAGFEEYWKPLGSRIGRAVKPIPVPEGAWEIRNRAINVRPEVVRRVLPLDMNVVLQTLPLPLEQKFDLVIATNVFVYYGALDQSLARANLATMIKPGGFLICNESLPEAAPSKLVLSGRTVLTVSETPPILDYMFTYLRRE